MILKAAVLLSFTVSILVLMFLVLRTFRFGKPSRHAEEQGSRTRGIGYAMGRGMMPWEKESAGNHLVTYFSGILYHSGIFLAILYLFLVVFKLTLPDPGVIFFRIVAAAGLLCGTGLLVKRILTPEMKSISCADDYIANLLVDLFIAAALLHSFVPEWETLFYIAGIVMFLYMPMGKIRHCFFFFYVRVMFGIFFGRRNVFPPQKKTG
jgi:hypothetical protein